METVSRIWGLEDRTQLAATSRLKFLLRSLLPQLPHQEQHCHITRASSSATYQCSSWDQQRRAHKHTDAFPCNFQGRIAQAWIPLGLGRSQDLYAGHKLRQQHLCLLVPDILLKRKEKGRNGSKQQQISDFLYTTAQWKIEQDCPLLGKHPHRGDASRIGSGKHRTLLTNTAILYQGPGKQWNRREEPKGFFQNTLKVSKILQIVHCNRTLSVASCPKPNRGISKTKTPHFWLNKLIPDPSTNSHRALRPHRRRCYIHIEHVCLAPKK